MTHGDAEVPPETDRVEAGRILRELVARETITPAIARALIFHLEWMLRDA